MLMCKIQVYLNSLSWTYLLVKDNPYWKDVHDKLRGKPIILNHVHSVNCVCAHAQAHMYVYWSPEAQIFNS